MGLAYVAYYHIVESFGTLATSGATYITPVVALAIGILLIGDAINPLGYLAMILTGVTVLQLGNRHRQGHGNRDDQDALQESPVCS